MFKYFNTTQTKAPFCAKIANQILIFLKIFWQRRERESCEYIKENAPPLAPPIAITISLRLNK